MAHDSTGFSVENGTGNLKKGPNDTRELRDLDMLLKIYCLYQSTLTVHFHHHFSLVQGPGLLDIKICPRHYTQCMFMQHLGASARRSKQKRLFAKCSHPSRTVYAVVKQNFLAMRSQVFFARYPELHSSRRVIGWGIHLLSSKTMPSNITVSDRLLPSEGAALCESGFATGGLAQHR